MLKTVFGDECLNMLMVFNLYKAIKKGRQNVEGERWMDQSSTTKANENVDCVHESLTSDC